MFCPSRNQVFFLQGAAKDEPCVSDYVTEIKVVDSNGDLVTYDDSDPEVFRAVQVSLS